MMKAPSRSRVIHYVNIGCIYVYGIRHRTAFTLTALGTELHLRFQRLSLTPQQLAQPHAFFQFKNFIRKGCADQVLSKSSFDFEVKQSRAVKLFDKFNKLQSWCASVFGSQTQCSDSHQTIKIAQKTRSSRVSLLRNALPEALTRHFNCFRIGLCGSNETVLQPLGRHRKIAKSISQKPVALVKPSWCRNFLHCAKSSPSAKVAV